MPAFVAIRFRFLRWDAERVTRQKGRARRSARAFAVAALVALGVVACADSPTEPSKPFEGTWIGTITTTLDGVPAGTATATLTQSGSQVTGSLHTIYPVPPNSDGSFSSFFGTASGTSLSAMLQIQHSKSSELPLSAQPHSQRQSVDRDVRVGVLLSRRVYGHVRFEEAVGERRLTLFKRFVRNTTDDAPLRGMVSLLPGRMPMLPMPLVVPPELSP